MKFSFESDIGGNNQAKPLFRLVKIGYKELPLLESVIFIYNGSFTDIPHIWLAVLPQPGEGSSQIKCLPTLLPPHCGRNGHVSNDTLFSPSLP